MKLLEGQEMSDALAALTELRRLADVDPRRVALIGHSFGGSLTVLMCGHEPSLRAAVIFSGAGSNDYSTNPGKALDAELARLGKPHRLKIYPAVGQTADDGHDFPNNSVATWEPDVFAFLDPYMRN